MNVKVCMHCLGFKHFFSCIFVALSVSIERPLALNKNILHISHILRLHVRDTYRHSVKECPYLHLEFEILFAQRYIAASLPQLAGL